MYSLKQKYIIISFRSSYLSFLVRFSPSLLTTMQLLFWPTIQLYELTLQPSTQVKPLIYRKAASVTQHLEILPLGTT